MFDASIAPSAAPAPTSVLLDFADHVLQPLLELAAVLRARHHATQVQPDQAAPGQRLRHLVVYDPLRDALGNRRLTDARLPDQYGVVLRAARQYFDRLLDLVTAADDGVDLAFLRHRRQIAAVLIQRRRRAPRLRFSRRLNARHNRSPQLCVRETEAVQ
jgi:hypothetical protein